MRCLPSATRRWTLAAGAKATDNDLINDIAGKNNTGENKVINGGGFGFLVD